MNEIKTPKKPIIFYYVIALLVLMLINFWLIPYMLQTQVKEVDYGMFMSMIKEKDIGRVEIQDNKILFTDKEDSKVYKTGVMNDPELTMRLYRSGAKFASQIIEPTSPFLSFLLTWILPLLIFFGIGQYMTKRMMKNVGGGTP